MNKYIFLIAFTSLIFSCKQEVEKVTEMVVSGTIANANGDSISFERFDDKYKFSVDSLGKFMGTIEGESGYYNMRYQRESTACFMNQGDSLSVDFDSKMFDETMKYGGSFAAANNYLAAKYLLQEEQGKKLNMKVLFSMPEDSFSFSMRDMEAEVLALLEGSDLPADFIDIEKSNLKYEVLSKMQNYESYHQYFVKDDSFKASDEFNKRFEEINYTNEADFNLIPEYRNMVLAHYTNDELPECLAMLKEVESAAIKDEALKRLTNWMSPGTEDLLENVNEMKALASTEELKMAVQDKYESMKMLTKGNESPGFKFKNTQDHAIDLADLKGKNVYIDVWATWCGPCKVEIPHLKKLEGDYHGKNIEFVSISVDVPKDEQKWKDMVADKELKGIQLISDNGWDTEFVDNYLIRGIPRFILLDAEGKIVSADAPRPSSDQDIREMIDNLVI